MLCLERVFRKLAGNTDIEDSLERLDKLTKEEAWMASAELLKMTSSIDGRVKGVDGKVRDVRSDVHEVRGDVHDVRGDVHDVRNDVRSGVHDIRTDVQGVDDKLDQVNSSLSFQLLLYSNLLYLFPGNQLRDSLSRWLLPSDPSTNHNNACKAHHNGTAQWFFEGSVFNQWKSTGSFLWVHGKRASLLAFVSFTTRRLLIISEFCSGIWEKYTLVCPSSTFRALVRLKSSI